MNVGAILDYVAGELDAQVLRHMQEHAIPPSLMDKVLDRIQSHVRQMKSEEYAQEMIRMQMDVEQQDDGRGQVENKEPQNGTKIQTIEDFKEEIGIGRQKNADI